MSNPFVDDGFSSSTRLPGYEANVPSAQSGKHWFLLNVTAPKASEEPHDDQDIFAILTL